MEYTNREAKAIQKVMFFSDQTAEHIKNLLRKEKEDFFRFELFVKYIRGSNTGSETKMKIIKFFKEEGLTYNAEDDFENLCSLIRQNTTFIKNLHNICLQTQMENSRIILDSVKIFSNSLDQNKINSFLSGLKQFERLRYHCFTYLVFGCIVRDNRRFWSHLELENVLKATLGENIKIIPKDYEIYEMILLLGQSFYLLTYDYIISL